jgi:hypothetical protein
MKWNLADVINAVNFKPDRPLEPRNYAFASEIGGSMTDRYLKMIATPMTSPPNERSRGKFLAGHIWQHTFEVILKVAGLYKDSEVKLDSRPYSDCIEVHGRCDIVAGAFDKDTALANLVKVAPMIPEGLLHKINGVVEILGGQPLETKILEIKSASEYIVEKVNTMKQPVTGHGLQAYYYSREAKLPASVCYISKNDSFMAEVEVNADMYEEMMRDDLQKITYYYEKRQMPPPEAKFWFNNLTGKFEKNWQVEYSPYIHIHGYNSPYEFRQAVEPQLLKWNNAIKRFVQVEFGLTTEKGNAIKMTPGAEEAKKEIILAGFDFDTIIEVKKRFIDVEEPENEEV